MPIRDELLAQYGIPQGGELVLDKPSEVRVQPVALPAPQPALPVEDIQPVQTPTVFEEMGTAFATPEGYDYSPYQKQWSREFTRSLSQRRFKDLKEYEDYVLGLPGAIEEIQPWVVEQAKKWMPDKLKRQLAYRQARQDRLMQEQEQQAENETLMRKLKEMELKTGTPYTTSYNQSTGRAFIRPMTQKEMLDLRIKEWQAKKAAQEEMAMSQSMAGGAAKSTTTTRSTTPKTKPPASPPSEPQEISERDLSMIQYIQQNPDDPRVPAIVEKLRRRGLIQ